MGGAAVNDYPPRYLPSEDEIREACAAIQVKWDDRERMRRAGLNPDAVLEVPTACSYMARQAGVDVSGKP